MTFQLYTVATSFCMAVYVALIINHVNDLAVSQTNGRWSADKLIKKNK